MAWKITKNKDGNYDVWSSVVEADILTNFDRDSLIDFYVGREASDAREKIIKWLREVDEDFNKNTK